MVNPMAAQDRLHLGHEGRHSRPPGRAVRRPGTEEQGAPRPGTKWLKPQRQLCLQSWEGIFPDSGAFGPWPGTGGWEVHLTPVDGPTGKEGQAAGQPLEFGSWTQETEGCPSPQTRAARAGHQATSCRLHSPASSAQGEPPSGDGHPLQALETEAGAASVPPPRTLSAPRLLSAAPATPALPQILSTLNHHALRAHHGLAGPSTARLLPALPLVGLQGPPHPSTCSPWSQAAAPAAPEHSPAGPRSAPLADPRLGRAPCHLL